MRETPELTALAAAYADDKRGTPAGNAEFTQEQYDVLRAHGLTRDSFDVRSVLMPMRPLCPGDIPDEHRAQAEMVAMPCPVLGEKLVAIDLMAPILLLPSGKLAVGPA